MKPALANVLACPVCQGALALDATEWEGEAIRAGILTCSQCGRTFPIEEGVPRFLLGVESAATRRGFDAQWRLRMKGKFEKKNTLYSHDHVELTRWWFSHCLGNVSPGEWLLDLGCGMAEKSVAVAWQHPDIEVVAMDMGDTVIVAASQPDLPPNLHFVQGDMMHPPLKKGAFAKIVSFGVLHHAPNARDSFRIAADILAPVGRLLVWLYPHPAEDWMYARFYHIRDRVFWGKAHRLSPLVLLWLVRIYCFVMAPVFLREYKRKIMPRFRDCTYFHLENLSTIQRYKTLVFVIFDILVAEHLARQRQSEVMGWFTEEGFTGVATDNEGHYWGERVLHQSAGTNS